MGSPRQKHWSGLPFPSLGDFPNPGTEPSSPALAGGFFFFFPTEPPRKPYMSITLFFFLITLFFKQKSVGYLLKEICPV